VVLRFADTVSAEPPGGITDPPRRDDGEDVTDWRDGWRVQASGHRSARMRAGASRIPHPPNRLAAPPYT